MKNRKPVEGLPGSCHHPATTYFWDDSYNHKWRQFPDRQQQNSGRVQLWLRMFFWLDLYWQRWRTVRKEERKKQGTNFKVGPGGCLYWRVCTPITNTTTQPPISHPPTHPPNKPNNQEGSKEQPTHPSTQNHPPGIHQIILLSKHYSSSSLPSSLPRW